MANNLNKNAESPKNANELAAKGGTTPAPIPADELPSRELDIEKAQAMFDGKSPEYVERIEEIENSKRLVKVEKDGETLRVHPSTVQAHLGAGWTLA